MKRLRSPLDPKVLRKIHSDVSVPHVVPQLSLLSFGPLRQGPLPSPTRAAPISQAQIRVLVVQRDQLYGHLADALDRAEDVGLRWLGLLDGAANNFPPDERREPFECAQLAGLLGVKDRARAHQVVAPLVIAATRFYARSATRHAILRSS